MPPAFSCLTKNWASETKPARALRMADVEHMKQRACQRAAQGVHYDETDGHREVLGATERPISLEGNSRRSRGSLMK